MVSKKRLLALVLLLLTAPGVYGLIWRFRAGLMDTALNNYVVWGFWVGLYIYFLGLSAGGFVVSTLVYGFGLRQLERVGKLAVWQAFVCMVLGRTRVWIDLGPPARFLYVLATPNPRSLLSWEAFIYVAYLLILLLELGLLAGARSVEELSATRRHMLRWLALGGVLVALGVHWGTGALFAVVKARPEWNTGITPVAFVVSAAASGAGLLMVLAALCLPHDETHWQAQRFLANVVAWALVADIVLLVSEGLVVWYGGVEHHVAAYRWLYFGPQWPLTWVLHVGIGIVIPLAIFATPLRRSHTLLICGAVAVVLGTVGYRMNIVIPAQIDAPFREMVTAFAHARNVNSYFPQPMEWLSSLGVVMGGVWLFWAGWHGLVRLEAQARR